MRYKEITIDRERVVSRKLLPMPDGIITHNTTWQPCDMADGPCCCGAWHYLDDWPEPLRSEIRQALSTVAEPENCEHSLKRDAILGGHYCIKCRAHFPYGCMWDEN